ncbi:hypothetical protein [Xylanimonas ulmi]|uniref:Uncharacterized protein n=1 Tax=Xylanimonas ulmi TaxID=228973 RepID=A0A4V2EXX8_9MICO|nr:hypothetical protein [Xylanibacterium ulmi]RZS61040.1 hypothetical protein EV386_1321 [Xylanibacterium ulmi]
MTYHTDRRPDEGDLALITEYDAHLSARHTELETTVTVLAQALAGLDESAWDGDAGSAWRTSLAEPRARLDAACARLSNLRPALSAYVTGVEGLATRAQPQRDKLDAAEEELRRLYWSSDYIGAWCAADDDARDRIRQELHEEAVRAQEEAWGALRDLHQERREIDAALCDALRVGEPAGWGDLRTALLHVGVNCVEDLDADGVGAAIFALAATIAAGDGSEQDVRDLTTLFGAWGTDHHVMARVFLQLGGGGTTRLIDELGHGVVEANFAPALALGLAQAIRSGLGNGSSRWTQSTASRFAMGMVDGGAAPSATGFLFGDAAGAPLGATLTVAMADLVDRRERDPNSMGHGMPWRDTTPMAGGRILAFLEDEEAGLRVDDLAGRVLQTLGQHPDEALAWLTDTGADPYGDGEIGVSRADYWFGERDWSAQTTGDGFEGPSALWAGAQQATGSLLDPHGGDPDVRRSVAALSTRVFELLSGNEQLVPDNLSAAGSVALATAIAQQIPQLAEYPMTHNSKEGGLLEAGILGGPDVWLVNAEQDWVADLYGVAAYDESGHRVLAVATSEYQESVVAYAASPDSPLSGGEAIERVLGTQAALEGAPVGSHLATGAAHDQQLRDTLGDVSSLVGLVPVPGGTLGGYTAGEAAGWFAEALGDSWATEYNEALAAERGGEDAREAIMRERLTTIIDTYVAHGVMGRPEDTLEYVNGLIDGYDDGFGNWAREAERGER